MNHGLFPQLVTLREEDHKYYHQNGDKYIGFSSFFENFLHKEFNAGAAAYSTAKSRIDAGVPTTAEDVKNEWLAKRDLGVRYDLAIQRYLNNKEILPADEDIADILKEVCAEYDYHKVITQMVTYNEQYKIAGSPDITGITWNRKDSAFEMSDIKVFEKDSLHEGKGWLNAPLSHLPATKFIKIALQLSFYAYQLEELTGRKCKRMFIHQINPITKTHVKTFVPYMKNDIVVCLEVFKEKIISLTQENKPMEAW